MHALNRVSRATGDARYTGCAMELAQAAHAGFTYASPTEGRKRMHWKMSTDLSRPLVPCMGQHDPLNGSLTYNELEMTVITVFGSSLRSGLNTEIAEMAGICRSMNLITDDPLGTGGLLADASRIASLMVEGNARFAGLLERVMEAALQGTAAFAESDSVRLPTRYRLAFRELGLSIGLKGIISREELIRVTVK